MRPKVVCHMMGPLDGQLVVDQWSASTGRPAKDLNAEYERVHKELAADAWIAGRAVGEEFALGKPHPPRDVPPVERPLHVARAKADEFAVLIDPDGKLHWTGGETDGAHIIMLLGPDVPDSHLAELAQDGISYLVSEESSLNLGKSLDVLGDCFGIRRLLLEGGAKTNAGFLAAGLVDEISFLLFPAIGARKSAPTLFEAGPEGLADRLRLTLNSTEVRKNGIVHLRYDVAYR